MRGKKDEPRTAKSKLTFVVLHLESGDETLQQSFRTIGQTLTQALQQGRTMAPKALQDGQTTAVSNEVEAEAVESELPEGEENELPYTSSKPRQRSAPKSPEVLDLNLNDASPRLKDFLAEKNPGDVDTKRYLVIAYWFKNHFNTTEVSGSYSHGLQAHGLANSERRRHPVARFEKQKPMAWKGIDPRFVRHQPYWRKRSDEDGKRERNPSLWSFTSWLAKSRTSLRRSTSKRLRSSPGGFTPIRGRKRLQVVISTNATESFVSIPRGASHRF